MFLRTIPPHAVIAPYIHHFWVFDAPAGLPALDARVVVPNGRAKLIVPWRNGLTAQATLASTRAPGRHSPEGEIVLVGLWDQPTTLSSTAGWTVTIGVEFTPTGLAHFIRQDLHEIFLEIAPVDALLGKLGEKLARRVAEADTATAAVALVHAFLIERALENGPSPRSYRSGGDADYGSEWLFHPYRTPRRPNGLFASASTDAVSKAGGDDAQKTAVGHGIREAVQALCGTPGSENAARGCA